MVKLKTKSGKKKNPVVVQNKKEDQNEIILPPVRMSDDPTPRQVVIFNPLLTSTRIIKTAYCDIIISVK